MQRLKLFSICSRDRKYFSFTFHYAKIKTRLSRIRNGSCSLSFTFHYAKIKTLVRNVILPPVIYLHSTMQRLKRSNSGSAALSGLNLHSTMQRLKPSILTTAWSDLPHLHSTMQRLKPPFKYLDETIFSLFTFHYAKIKTSIQSRHNNQRYIFTFHYAKIKTCVALFW